MRMSWVDLLFAHFRVDPDQVQSLLPSGMQLDLYEGQAFVGVVPFVMDNVGVRRWPSPSSLARFCELNVRTYVVVGERPGVWFFSLDAQSRFAVEGARRFFNLPYFMADMQCAADGPRLRYASTRTDGRIGPGSFVAAWEPTSSARSALPGSLEHWLTERYCLYSCDRGGHLYRAEVHHRRWPLRDASADIEENTVCDSHGIALLTDEPILHSVRQLDVLGWWAERV